MKILLCLLLAVGALAAQVVVLDEGWKRISEGKEMDPGQKFLGVWQNENEKHTVGVVWARQLPPTPVFLRETPEFQGGIDPLDWPVEAALLEGPKLGLRVRFREELDGVHEELVWFFGKEGGILMKANCPHGVEFSLEGWNSEGKVEDPDGGK